MLTACSIDCQFPDWQLIPERENNVYFLITLFLQGLPVPGVGCFSKSHIYIINLYDQYIFPYTMEKLVYTVTQIDCITGELNLYFF